VPVATASRATADEEAEEAGEQAVFVSVSVAP
jgi:hypothetical protein